MLEVKGRVQQMLTDMVGSVTVDSDGDFGIVYESTKVFVQVVGWGDQVLVRVFSQFLRDVPLSPELYRWVATEGQNYLFGHTTIVEMNDGSGRLDFEAYLLADYLDFEELRVSVSAVAVTSDRLDDELQAKFGGKRFSDR